MAQSESSSDGFQTASAPNGNYEGDDAEWTSLPEEGEEIQGIVLSLTPNSGDFDQLRVRYKSTDGDDEGEIRLVHFNQTLEDTVHENGISEGYEFRLVGVDSYTWTDDDGNDRDGTERELQYRQ